MDAYKKAGEIAAAKGDTVGVKKFAELEEGVAKELVLHKVSRSGRANQPRICTELK